MVSKWVRPEVNTIDRKLFPLPLPCWYTGHFSPSWWAWEVMSHSAAHWKNCLSTMIQRQQTITLESDHKHWRTFEKTTVRRCTWKFNIFRRISWEEAEMVSYMKKKRQRKRWRPLTSELCVIMHWKRICRDNPVQLYKPGIPGEYLWYRQVVKRGDRNVWQTLQKLE